MPDLSSVGKTMLFIGLGLVAIGVLLTFAGKFSASGSGLGWIGKLPGDIYVKRNNYTFYFPITTSIIVSVLGSLILYVLLRR